MSLSCKRMCCSQEYSKGVFCVLKHGHVSLISFSSHEFIVWLIWQLCYFLELQSRSKSKPPGILTAHWLKYQLITQTCKALHGTASTSLLGFSSLLPCNRLSSPSPASTFFQPPCLCSSSESVLETPFFAGQITFHQQCPHYHLHENLSRRFPCNHDS